MLRATSMARTMPTTWNKNIPTSSFFRRPPIIPRPLSPIVGTALLVEISTHLIVWRGMAYFHCNPFVEVPNHLANTTHKPAAAIYPSSSRRQLLEDGANGSPNASTGGSISLLASDVLAAQTMHVCVRELEDFTCHPTGI